jgi:5'-nucleotidase
MNMSQSEPRILLTNDGGHAGSGLKTLRNLLINSGMRVVTVARPSQAECDTSLARSEPHEDEGNPIYLVDGDAAECVRFAGASGLADDVGLVVYGINEGLRLGIESASQGALEAIIEGVALGKTVLAVSQAAIEPLLPDAKSADYDFRWAAEVAVEFAALMTTRPPPAGTALNINVPSRLRTTKPELTVMRFTDFESLLPVTNECEGDAQRLRLARSVQLSNLEPGLDEAAVSAGRVSVTPLLVDSGRFVAEPNVHAWALRALHILEPRLVGESVPCSCCT